MQRQLAFECSTCRRRSQLLLRVLLFLLFADFPHGVRGGGLTVLSSSAYEVTLRWNASTGVSGIIITGYTIRANYTECHGRLSTSLTRVGPAATVSRLPVRPFRRYSLEVRPESSSSDGTWSVPTYVNTSQAEPTSPPQDVKAILYLEKFVIIVWKPIPCDDRNSPTLTYNITSWRKGISDGETLWTSPPVTGSGNTHLLAILHFGTNATAGNWTVSGGNSFGSSPLAQVNLPAKSATQDDVSSRWLTISVGVLGTALLFLIALVMLQHLRRKGAAASAGQSNRHGDATANNRKQMPRRQRMATPRINNTDFAVRYPPGMRSSSSLPGPLPLHSASNMGRPLRVQTSTGPLSEHSTASLVRSLQNLSAVPAIGGEVEYADAEIALEMFTPAGAGDGVVGSHTPRERLSNTGGASAQGRGNWPDRPVALSPDPENVTGRVGGEAIGGHTPRQRHSKAPSAGTPGRGAWPEEAGALSKDQEKGVCRPASFPHHLLAGAKAERSPVSGQEHVLQGQALQHARYSSLPPGSTAAAGREPGFLGQLTGPPSGGIPDSGQRKQSDSLPSPGMPTMQQQKKMLISELGEDHIIQATQPQKMERRVRKRSEHIPRVHVSQLMSDAPFPHEPGDSATSPGSGQSVAGAAPSSKASRVQGQSAVHGTSQPGRSVLSPGAPSPAHGASRLSTIEAVPGEHYESIVGWANRRAASQEAQANGVYTMPVQPCADGDSPYMPLSRRDEQAGMLAHMVGMAQDQYLEVLDGQLM